MAYPTSIDTFPTLVDGQPAFAAYFNDIHAAITAIETALGTTTQSGTLSSAVTPFLLMGA